MLYLAQHSEDDRKIGAKGLAEKLDVPSPFLAKILQDLSKKKIISSTKGPKGGFYLTDENKSQKLLVVVAITDGLDWFNECILGLPECNADKPCPVHQTFQPIRKKMYDNLNNNSIGEFVTKLENGDIHLGLT